MLCEQTLRRAEMAWDQCRVQTPPAPPPLSHPGRHKLKHLTLLPFYPPPFLGCYNCRFDEMKIWSFSCLLKAKKEYLLCLVCTLMVTSFCCFFFFFKCGCYRACVIVNTDKVWKDRMVQGVVKHRKCSVLLRLSDGLLCSYASAPLYRHDTALCRQWRGGGRELHQRRKKHLTCERQAAIASLIQTDSPRRTLRQPIMSHTRRSRV